ncbi:MAG: hypothetical protein Q8N47_14175 [Bryobacterales bacterium]|nr:hypothetical protein [Bryobacterales bacterium]
MTNQLSPAYPWYALISEGDEIQQGDLLESCPVFTPPADLDLDDETAEFEWVGRDVVVMSQSCDLVKGRAKVEEVLLCAVWRHRVVEPGQPVAPGGSEAPVLIIAFSWLGKSSSEHYSARSGATTKRRISLLPTLPDLGMVRLTATGVAI